MSTTTALKFSNTSSKIFKDNVYNSYDIATNQNFTIEWWQKFDGITFNPILFEAFDPNYTDIAFSFEFSWNITTLLFDIILKKRNGTYQDTISLGTISSNNIVNKWVHIAITRTSNTLRVFLNGTQIGINMNSTESFSLQNTNNYTLESIYIGHNKAQNPNKTFTGLLYNFIWIVGNSLYNTTFIPTNNKSYSSKPTGTKFFLFDTINLNFDGFTSSNIINETISLSDIILTPQLIFNSISNKTYGTDTSFSLSSLISSNSSGAISYESSNTSIATVDSNGLVTILTPGTITVTITQAATSGFTAATASQTLTINKIATTITFNNMTNRTYDSNNLTYDISSLISSTRDSSTYPYTYTSSNTSIATIDSNGIITIIIPGTVNITVSQAATDTYALGTATKSLTINKIPTTITFNNMTTQTYSPNGTYDISSLISSTRDSTTYPYTYSSSNTSIATIDSNGIITIKGATVGITITVSQVTNTYYAAGTASKTLIINKATPQYTIATLPTLTYGTNSTLNLSSYVTSTSGSAITYTSSNTAIATINSTGTTLTIKAAGTVNITASQVANTNYLLGSRTISITINGQLPNITFNTLPILTYGIDNTLNLSSYITSNNTGSTLTFTSSDPTIASISGNTLTVLNSGEFTITANQVASGNYAGTSVTSNPIIIKAIPNISFNLPESIIHGSLNINLTDIVSSNNNLGNITYTTSNNSIGEIVGNELKIKNIGNITVTVQQASTSTFSNASISKNLYIKQATISEPLNIVNNNHLISAIIEFSVPFININSTSDIFIRNNTLNTNKLFTNNNTVKVVSNNNVKLMY